MTITTVEDCLIFKKKRYFHTSLEANIFTNGPGAYKLAFSVVNCFKYYQATFHSYYFYENYHSQLWKIVLYIF